MIICSKNEAERLKENLPHVLSQDYPDFELIVVNDRSTDDTAVCLEQFAVQYPNFKSYSTDPENAPLKGKRNALKVGLEHAQGSYLLFTDADCKPVSNKWVREMSSSAIAENKDVICGISPLSGKNQYPQLFFRHEAVITSLLYVSAALWGAPYMAVGRNLLVKKALYAVHFDRIAKSASLGGDDDLFINHLPEKSVVGVCLSQNSMTVSAAPKDMRSGVRQKIRHVSAGKHYNFLSKLLLSCWAASNLFALIFFFLILFLSPQFFKTIAFFWGFKWLSGFTIYYFYTKQIGVAALAKNYIVLDCLYALNFLTLGTFLLWEPKKWK